MALHLVKRASSYAELSLLVMFMCIGALIALFNMVILRDRPTDIYSWPRVKERMFGKSWQMIGMVPAHWKDSGEQYTQTPWAKCVRITLGHQCAKKEQDTPVPKLVAQASGVVLEIGPGIGNQIPRYDRSKVTRVYGVEPNPEFPKDLRQQIKAVGMTDEYTIVPHGIQETALLNKYGITPESIDTIVDVQVLCSVPDPESVVKAMYGMLKPGGKWIVYEHIQSRDPVTKFVQSKCAPSRAAFPWNSTMRGIVLGGGS